MKNTTEKYIIRVYGIYINSDNCLLVSDEIVKGEFITKFPGGGLEFGEGLIDCLIREMKEETGIDFEVKDHFYTTGFFVESAFHPGKQIISIYYLMQPLSEFNRKLSEKKFDFENISDGEQSFRFVNLNQLNPNEFTFIIDKHVATLLSHHYENILRK
jgi:ADP-ribose pyrophosphatase YjhB (NUDIX family)